MPSAFVTGATGFLGRHLIDVLTEQGWTIHILARDRKAAEALFGDRVRYIEGKLSQPTAYAHQVPEDLDALFHIAANTSTWKADAASQYLVNVEGTAALLQLATDKDVGRFIHVSSTSVYGIHHTPVTEETEKLGSTSWVSYVNTKTFAERKVKEATWRGMDAVIVNPTHIIGRYDSRNWARLILRHAKGSLPGTPPGAGNFANARAVAEALLAAFEKGKTGENYILGGPYASMYDFLALASDKLGLPEPKHPTSAFFLKLAAGVLSLRAAFSGKRPMVTPEEAYFASEVVDAKSDKAVKDLGYRIVPLEQSVDECIAYLKEEKLL
ncbi:NAD-dependent epimerase/dehydratase family protein [Kordiimonas aestuarii]|uniref:NAD-dependent epimerase/dehydratase family protein n=1 Tax=Kordiimonas aestuarii TaxID=1005925 RepID=UPI0021D306A9|nr:NAD-dependent epimerase/dehydratase family protein [Kordiimonas aestuarii]